MEEWKKIKDFPIYEVSNFGRIRNTERNIILTTKDKKVTLYYEGKQACKNIPNLVYVNFIEDKPVSRFFFKDNNPNNFRWDNLYTTKERNAELLKDYIDGMSLNKMREKYKVDNPHSLGWKLGGRRKAKPKLKVTATIDKPELVEPTCPIILRLREKYRQSKYDNKENGYIKNSSIRMGDMLITAQPKQYSL